MKKVKNTKASSDVWVGMTIAPGAYYEIEPLELIRWQNNSKVLSDIGAGDLVVNDGESDITDVATAINFLKDIVDKFNETGYRVFAPTFEDLNGMTTTWKGSLYTAPAHTLSIFDEEITSEEKLREGWYKIISGGTAGDYIEFSIVDKNNVLGLFATYGLTVGVDVLELKKYIKTEYISPSPLDPGRQDFRSNAASELAEGLFVRIAYYNASLVSQVKFTVTRKYHES